jgi:hypothetical protein
MRRRVFIWWSSALGLLWLFANWPRSIKLGNYLEMAGFPFTFALWAGGRLETFDLDALALDCSLGAMVIFGLASLCACSRKKSSEGGGPPDRGP